MDIVRFGILGLLMVTAVMVARQRNLWAAIMASGIFSFLGASWMMLLDAPDVSFTEAAVGAGISTVLMLSTLALVGKQEVAGKVKPLPLITVTLTGLALIYGTLDMPLYGDPNAPIHLYPSPGYVEKSMHDMHGLPNVVTSVLGSYRAFDTLGETMVVFTAGIAALLILLSDPKTPPPTLSDGAVPVEQARLRMSDFLIIRVVSKMLIPFIILFGLYVQFHGDYGPGGGFQAGVIIAAAFILYGLVYGLDATQRVAPKGVVEKLLALGLMMYAGTGFLTLLMGGKYLEYNVLEHHWLEKYHVPSGQHLGIFLIELGVGLTVTSVMITIYYAFAGRRPAV
ncbi:Na(+)/H(+) antiporter subunit B [Pirellulaceae bacterium SH449]